MKMIATLFARFTLVQINYALAVVIGVLGIVAMIMALSSFSSNSTDDIPVDSNVAIIKDEVFDNWRYQCKIDKTLPIPSCYLVQEVESTLSDGETLSVQMRMVMRGASVLPRLKVIAPLGVFLPAGITVDLAVQDSFTVPYQFCTDEGCFINLDLAPEVVAALAVEDVLRISYRRADHSEKSVALPLSGLKDALARLSETK